MSREWYWDSYGLLVQRDGDGGDTAQRMGMWGIGNSQVHRDVFWNGIKTLEIEPGVWVRHPYQPPYCMPEDFSRDQQTPNVIAMGLQKMYEPLTRMFRQHVKRFGKYQNKDWASPEHWGYYVRAFRWWGAYPYLLLSDIWMFFGVLRKRG
jgi:hypothetical protein